MMMHGKVSLVNFVFIDFFWRNWGCIRYEVGAEVSVLASWCQSGLESAKRLVLDVLGPQRGCSQRDKLARWGGVD